MNREKLGRQLAGCYIPLPTLFRGSDLELNLEGMKRHVRFLLEHGVREGNGVLLVGGGAGEFAALSLAERFRILDAVIEAADGKVQTVFGAQTTSQRELVQLGRHAAKAGAVAVQAGPPFYLVPTHDDVYDWLAALADAADIGVVFYNTYWTGYRAALDLLARLTVIPQIVGIKWSSPDSFEYEQALREFSKRFLFIDNQVMFVFAHMLGARGINLHMSNYAPAWGLKFWQLLDSGQYRQAQSEMTRVVSPYYDLYTDISRFTGGEGHIDKLCMEMVGLDGGRCRPPTRDIRARFEVPIRQMLLTCGLIEEQGQPAGSPIVPNGHYIADGSDRRSSPLAK